MLKMQQVQRIWQQAQHNAFTDLIDYNAALWCVFREGSAHVSADGAFRILRSTDGVSWHSLARLAIADADLRDAKFCLTSNGQLAIYGVGAWHNKSQASHQTYCWLSADGEHWSAPEPIGDTDIWLWRMAWQHNQLFAVGYHVAKPAFIRLYQGADVRQLRRLDEIYRGSFASESALMFQADATALCLLRRDPGHGLLGRSRAPYTDWQWQDLGCRIGGPQWLQLADGRLLACVRLYDKTIRTSLCWIDADTGRLTEALVLPSGGDCSYAGMVQRGNRVYISYYSSHEGSSAIYLARLTVGTAI
ncbi:MAG: sialidase family protein [Rheinheimera sp.]|nr:sialidase family protein [Rheinheimera sp.]